MPPRRSLTCDLTTPLYTHFSILWSNNRFLWFDQTTLFLDPSTRSTFVDAHNPLSISARCIARAQKGSWGVLDDSLLSFTLVLVVYSLVWYTNHCKADLYNKIVMKLSRFFLSSGDVICEFIDSLQPALSLIASVEVGRVYNGRECNTYQLKWRTQGFEDLTPGRMRAVRTPRKLISRGLGIPRATFMG